ncbi:hypothetical protein GCM10009839_51580 [Catenulispora yoronensis]|uniref:Uncharacterized protein n=1 Tax=Catenulispora yoronensis TaxID=450799 RepID=A0ABP5GD60_9ACTN
MTDTVKDATKQSKTENHIRAILVGGPSSLPEMHRIQSVSPQKDKIKIVHQGGYEHFERRTCGSDNGPGEIHFHWTMRTKVAE